MRKIFPVVIGWSCIMAVESCSKKMQPIRTTTSTEIKSDTVRVIKKNDSLAALKPVMKPAMKRKPPEPIPKVITVNDQFAHKSVDGRYYYDLQGHRYWRNNKDGKYYLFNKSMLTDDAFKKPD